MNHVKTFRQQKAVQLILLSYDRPFFGKTLGKNLTPFSIQNDGCLDTTSKITNKGFIAAASFVQTLFDGVKSQKENNS